MKRMFYSCLPGLELLLAQQLRPLQARVISGGCEVTSSSVSSPSVASHRLERIASFQCRFFSELLEEVKKMPVKNDGLKLELSVSASKSRLYHVGAIAERIQRHIEVVEKGQGDARLLFRLHRDVCEVSLERGDPFHKRGYRLEGGKAPLREDLAAALIEASAIDFKNELVIDPFCGSGTVVIEAALKWKAEKSDDCNTVKFVGGDRDAGAIEMANRNAARAGVGDVCVFSCCSFSELLRSHHGGDERVVVVSHPPFGARAVADKGRLEHLYSGLGKAIKPGWRVVVLVNDDSKASLIGNNKTLLFRSLAGGKRVAAFLITKETDHFDKTNSKTVK